MEKYPVWDFPTRLFHWLLALSFCGSWFTAEAGIEWFDYHFYFGYLTLGLILFRLCWGFLGSPYARFRQFLVGPVEFVRALSALPQRKASHEPGHSATGGWAAMVLLCLCLIQAGSGLFITDDIFYYGPYNSVVSSDTAGTLAYIHHTNFTILQVFIALHILTILWYQWGKKENLLLPMISGNKALTSPPESVVTQWGRAIVLAAISTVAITLMVELAPEPVFAF